MIDIDFRPTIHRKWWLPADISEKYSNGKKRNIQLNNQSLTLSFRFFSTLIYLSQKGLNCFMNWIRELISQPFKLNELRQHVSQSTSTIHFVISWWRSSVRNNKGQLLPERSFCYWKKIKWKPMSRWRNASP